MARHSRHIRVQVLPRNASMRRRSRLVGRGPFWRPSSSPRLGARGVFRGQILVEGPRQARRAAALCRSQHPHDQELSRRRGGHDIASLNEAARFQRAGAIDADLAGLDQPRSTRPRLHEPCTPQPLVEALCLHRRGSASSRLARGKAPLERGEGGEGRMLDPLPLRLRAMGRRLSPLGFLRLGARFVPRLVARVLVVTCSSALAWTPDLVDGDRLGCGGGVRRFRLRRSCSCERPPLAPEAERLQDRGELFARATDHRHQLRHHPKAAIPGRPRRACVDARGWCGTRCARG